MKWIGALLVGAVVFFAYRLFGPIIGSVITVITAFIVVWYNRITYFVLRGRRAYADGHFGDALKYFKKAVDTGKAKFNIRVEYADVMMRAGRFEDAESMYNNILRYKVKPEERNICVMRRCMAYYKQGNLSEALADAEEVYESGFKNTYLYGLLGYLKIQTGPKSDEAYEFCREAYEYNKDDRDIMDNLLICCYNRGDYTNAKKLSDKIMESSPKFVEAYYHGALVEYALGNYDKVIEYLDETPACRWSEMTTVKKEEIDALREKAEAAGGQKKAPVAEEKTEE